MWRNRVTNVTKSDWSSTFLYAGRALEGLTGCGQLSTNGTDVYFRKRNWSLGAILQIVLCACIPRAESDLRYSAEARVTYALDLDAIGTSQFDALAVASGKTMISTLEGKRFER